MMYLCHNNVGLTDLREQLLFDTELLSSIPLFCCLFACLVVFFLSETYLSVLLEPYTAITNVIILYCTIKKTLKNSHLLFYYCIILCR